MAVPRCPYAMKLGSEECRWPESAGLPQRLSPISHSRRRSSDRRVPGNRNDVTS
jgi:hypothetical protein